MRKNNVRKRSGWPQMRGGGLSQGLAWCGLGWWREEKERGGRAGRAEVKLAQMSLARVCVCMCVCVCVRVCVCVCVYTNPGADRTYLQRLNKTSLCQTIQGMAGHSLCGVEGWREGGREEGMRREGRGGRGMRGRGVGEGGRGERRTVAWVSHGRSITGGEVKGGGGGRGGRGWGTEGPRHPRNMWQHGWDGMLCFKSWVFWVCEEKRCSGGVWRRGPGVLLLEVGGARCRREEAGGCWAAAGGDRWGGGGGVCQVQEQQPVFPPECNTRKW